MAEVAVSVTILLAGSVLSYLSDEGHSKASVSTEVESIRTLLHLLNSYLNYHSGRGSQNEIQANKAAQIRGIVHKIEDALDEFMFHCPSKFHKNGISINGVVQPIKRRGPERELCTAISDIKKSVTDLQEWYKFANHLDSTIEAAPINRRGDSFVHSLEEDEMEGYENRTVTLIDQLVREEQKSHMDISVVGPGGFGKSTFARIAYVDKQVKRHFDCSVWVTVSESFDETALVDDMILQLEDEIKGSISSERGDKRSQMRSYLRNKRYLVVLDDVCNKKDLHFIKSFLPKNSGSRIIVTTHKHDVVVSPHHCVHDLSSGLSEEAAWNLFCRKAFLTSGKSCPSELVGIARKILTKCGGSPYAILSVSSALDKKSQLPAEWQLFHDTLVSEVGTDPHRIVSKTLLRSYNDLPSTLKSCLLYLSLFPGNYPIERGRLIRLWLAEGFVKPANGKTLERVADDYLDELIAGNLIHVTQRDFSGRAIICAVNNLVHAFLINKSKEENFITILVSEEDAETSNLRRVSIRLDAVELSKLKSEKWSSVRSSLMFSKKETFQPRVGNFIGQFKLLKVLDMQGSHIDNFPEEICRLTLLRYLSLRGTRVNSIPSSINNLAFMETLDLKQTQVRTLPHILRLPNLRYLLVYLYDVHSYVTLDSVKGVKLCPELNFLTKLLKLTLIEAKDRKFIEELGHLKDLRKLGLVDLKTEDGRALCVSIQKMTQLSTLDVSSVSESEFLDIHNMADPPRHLQRLYLKGPLTTIPEWIPTLQSLVRIGLLWSKLRDTPIPALQLLPNLIELKLVDAYIGEELVFRTGSFTKLRTLHIEACMKLAKITIQDNTMPKLSKFTLCKCEDLTLPPLGIVNLAQLREFEAHDMSDEFTTSLRPSGNNYWMIAHIPVISSFHFGRSGKWISNE